jgi:hypothetical protein
LMTSAPMSPSIMVQNGAGLTRVRSSTRIAAQGSPSRRHAAFLSQTRLARTARDGVHALAGATRARQKIFAGPSRRGARRSRRDRGLDGHAGSDLQPSVWAP